MLAAVLYRAEELRRLVNIFRVKEIQDTDPCPPPYYEIRRIDYWTKMYWCGGTSGFTLSLPSITVSWPKVSVLAGVKHKKHAHMRSTSALYKPTLASLG